MVLAAIALFVSLGGSAFAVSSGTNPTGESADRAASRGKLTLRFGKIVDRDTTPFDGIFNYATGHATCAKGERVISGGVRHVKNPPPGDGSHIWMVETGPVPKKRGWYVEMSSDLGGAARSNFLVVANCERR